MIKNCRKCFIELNKLNCAPSFLKRGIAICRSCNNLEDKLRMIKNRKTIIFNLGGKCQCCGIDNAEILSIDHINGNGIEDRKKFTKWKRYLKALSIMDINDLKSKYRCLCYNCNYSLGFWGVCPHSFNELSKNDILSNLEKLPVCNRGLKNINLSKINKKIRNGYIKKIQRIKHKLEMIQAYDNKCIKCEEKHPMFLVLDHINNNGNRENTNKGTNFYQYLKNVGYPGKNIQLQLLCHNCNAQKEYINNRINKSEIIKHDAEIYVKQNYSLTKNQDQELWLQARYLLAQISIIKNNQTLAGISAVNASVLAESISELADDLSL